MCVMIGRSVHSSTSTKDITETELLKKELKAAISIMTTLGLGWLIVPFQFLVPSGGKVYVQFLFIFFNSIQGLLMFIFSVVFNDSVYKHWTSRFFPKTDASSTKSATALSSSPAKTDANVCQDIIEVNEAVDESGETEEEKRKRKFREGEISEEMREKIDNFEDKIEKIEVQSI